MAQGYEGFGGNPGTCANCGEAIEPDAAFCTACGARVEVVPSQTPLAPRAFGGLFSGTFRIYFNNFLKLAAIVPRPRGPTRPPSAETPARPQ